MKYDVAIVGAGPSGYFCAYELVKKNPSLKVVLLDKVVPAYRQPRNDARAAAIIGECFPGRTVVSIDCADIILEGGALHCLSQNLF